ncbi:hypothetical protein HY448_00715 [Candidatus Pacearchaeota archaeon]|nr:hypothetical protein [Candidatus Pacearchaeota archaeon]
MTQTLDIKLIKDREDLKNLPLGSIVKLNIGDETYLAVYKKGEIKLWIDTSRIWRRITGGPTYRFAIKRSDNRIIFTELRAQDLVIYGGEIYLPSEFSDPKYPAWRKVDSNSLYGQNINKKFARVGL